MNFWKLFGALLLLAIFSLNAMAEQLHPLGLLEEDPRDKPWITESTLSPREGLPAVYYNPAYLPPVGNQGSQGSCTAWAVAYYFKTYQEAKEKHWDPADPAHQCSPAFMYNLINGGKDGGSFISDAFKLLEDVGCGTLADMPYNAGNFSDWPSETAWENALPFRTLNTHFIATGTNTGIEQIKTALNNGHLLVIGITVYPNFDNISSFNNTYCVNDVYGAVRGGHAVTIIGYDDNKVTADGVGAFRMVNSWGSNWGDNGFWWMSYEAVKSSLLCHGEAYYAEDRQNYSPELVARYQIAHPKRGSIEVSVGVGDPANPAWEHTFFDFYMNNWSSSSFPYPSNRILLDASDGAAYLTPSSSENFYLKVRDKDVDFMTGEVQFFRGEFAPAMLSAACPATPTQIQQGASATPVKVAVGGEVSVYPFLLNFEPVLMGSHQEKQIRFYNPTAQSIDFQLSAGSGTSTAFSFSQPTVSLPAGAEQMVTVSYDPANQGQDAGTIQVSSTVVNDRIRLKGEALGTLSFTNNSVDFGQVEVGANSTQTVWIKNIGPQSETLTLSIAGNDAAHFSVGQSQLSVNAGDSASVEVTFAPLSAEQKHALLVATAPGQEQQLELSGFGIGMPVIALPVNQLQRSVLESDSMIAMLEIGNSGSAVLSYTVSFVPQTGSGWAEVLTPTGSVTPGASRKVNIRLRGLQTGTFSGEIQIQTNESGQPTRIVPLELTVNSQPATSHFSPVFNGNPYQPMRFRMIKAEWQGVALEAGDEVAVYDGGLCVGTVVLPHTVGNGYEMVMLEASADDPATPETDGFTGGNAITFKIWDASAAAEFTVNELEFLNSGGNPVPTPTFTPNGFAIVQVGTVTGLETSQPARVSSHFELAQNYPNPFNPQTTITYHLPQTAEVELSVYNILGQKVRVLVSGHQSAGSHSVIWDGRNTAGQRVPSGIYFYRLFFKNGPGQKVLSRKMVLMQ